VLQTQEQQHSIIYGTQQRQRMHVLLVQLQVGLVSKKGFTSLLYSLHSLFIVLFHLGTITKKYLAYHLINYDSSFSILSYTCTNLFSRELTLHRNRRGIHTIPKMSTQIGLSKENGGSNYLYGSETKRSCNKISENA